MNQTKKRRPTFRRLKLCDCCFIYLLWWVKRHDELVESLFQRELLSIFETWGCMTDLQFELKAREKKASENLEFGGPSKKVLFLTVDEKMIDFCQWMSISWVKKKLVVPGHARSSNSRENLYSNGRKRRRSKNNHFWCQGKIAETSNLNQSGDVRRVFIVDDIHGDAGLHWYTRRRYASSCYIRYS